MGDAGILEVFLGEAREIIQNLESDIVKLEDAGYDDEIINRIFRAFHTLKGSAGIAGMNEIYEFAHKLENLLDEIRSGSLEINDTIIDLVFNSMDWIKDHIFSEGPQTPLMAEARDKLENLIENIKGGGAAPVQSAATKKEVSDPSFPDGTRYFRVKAAFRENIFEFGIDPLMVMEDLVMLGTIITKIVDKTQVPEFPDMDPEKCYISWDIILKTTSTQDKVDDVFLFVKDGNTISIENITEEFMTDASGEEYPREKKVGEILVEKGILTEDQLDEAVEFQETQKAKIGDIVVDKGLATEDQVKEALTEQDKIKRKIEVSTIRVDTKKLDNLLNLLGEIVIGQSSLSRMAEDLDDEDAFQLKNALFGLDRSTREFQEQIMSIRMVPIGPTFDQFRRFVRDASHNLGKRIQLEVEGGDVELDKTVVEKIGDPLKHMIRNSIDHGIESEEERVAAGKPKLGTMTLKAYHQEGNVYIDVIDDGGGINLKRVKEKAVSNGIIGKDEEISRERLLALLFHPGFSTAQKVGDLSGRGVGMDVVKTNIEEMRGSVQILTEEGKGTTMRVKLPLTMAIIDGMMVRVGKNIYIIPLLSVIESIQPVKENVKTVEEQGEVIYARGEYSTLIRLYDHFGIDSQFKEPWDALVVMVESGNSKLGLMVDELLGQQQIVIKSLDSSISGTRAVSGAAILGDGTVALIIDIHGLMQDFS